jgi:glutaminyl-peptide cyclotransferase
MSYYRGQAYEVLTVSPSPSAGAAHRRFAALSHVAPDRVRVVLARVGVVLGLAVAAAGCTGEVRDARVTAGLSGLIIDTARVPPFSAESAHALLRRQVAFGPRVPGSAGHAAQLDWMLEFLRERADSVSTRPFRHTAADGTLLRMTNVFAQFKPDAARRILLVAHWDTRPTADMDAERPDAPIAGANDGASGTAVLLELADVLSRHSAPVGVDLLFVDGEDYGPGESHMYLGAKHFAANQPQGYRPLYGIVVDMVADRTPLFPMEGNSIDLAPDVVGRVWGVAAQIGLGHVFPQRNGGWVTDDHVPLNKAGIRTIAIIDFDYGPGNAYWHTHHDVVENTAPDGLGYVGRVLASLIYSGG